MKREKIAVIPQVHGLGGMVSFQDRFIAGLQNRGYQITQNLHDSDITAVLVIGGTRKMGDLLTARQKGIRVVQRLNGMNWMHRVQPTPTRKFLRAEVNNLLLAFIRRLLSNRIVYQSQFSQWWWDNRFGKVSKPQTVVFNGVNLEQYAPSDRIHHSTEMIHILLLEGRMDDFYISGLDTGFQLSTQLHQLTGIRVHLSVAGELPESLKNQYRPSLGVETTFLGIIPPESVPEHIHAAHMLFSADLNAACPNAVVEALACGLPVCTYNTGALSEMVPENAGIVVPYGSNHWKLEKPDIPALAQAAYKIYRENALYRSGARDAAVAQFNIEKMLDGYLAALLG